MMDFSFWFSHLHAAAETIGAVATAYLAFAVYQYTKRKESLDQSTQIQNERQLINEIAIGNDDILLIEAKSHPYGELSVDQTRQMYWYFLILNAGYNTWLGRSFKYDVEAASSDINNMVNVTYKDRDFISKHVLSRGYSAAFVKEIKSGWEEISKAGKMKGMV